MIPNGESGERLRGLCLSLCIGGLCVVLALGASPARAGEAELAYFNTKNIFYSGLKGTKVVALTFDDGPNANTLRVLETLKAHGIKATFFIVGQKGAKNPDLVRRIAEEGHLLANHTADHKQLTSRFAASPHLLFGQLRKVHDQIAPYIHAYDRLFFRAPYGSWRSEHAALLNADPDLKHYIGPIFWDVGGDTIVTAKGYVWASADWDCWRRGWSAETCGNGYLREIERKQGGVVLIHDIHAKSAAMIAQMVPILVNDGYRFARLDQLPAYDRYETPKDEPTAVALGPSAPRLAH